ncbi:hypothetical protein DERP_004784 [Dermatophagoides pteronyssinus]|uniref:Uncharacterized protein n=1 Tax=Dermatophagoides pteronyssinus TaxID=6956 RepID=A0ABQ8JSI9_DERPT|nr:hypothetical protein DERP_004784 [Dermatophagoides pteronyssinus]
MSSTNAFSLIGRSYGCGVLYLAIRLVERKRFRLVKLTLFKIIFVIEEFKIFESPLLKLSIFRSDEPFSRMTMFFNINESSLCFNGELPIWDALNFPGRTNEFKPFNV